jgi:hypothetical protein
MKYTTAMKSIKAALVIAVLFFTQASYADRYMTIGGIAEHIGSDGYRDFVGYRDYNERANNISGIEIVNEETQTGIGYMRFVNSYYNKGSLIYISNYWELNEHVKVGVFTGVVQGYKDWQLKKLAPLGNELHFMVAPIVKFETDNLFTQVAAYGNAIVVTFGAKF